MVLSMVVQVAITCVLTAAMFRSIGMLGRHQPEIQEELPEKDNYLAVAISVAGALVVGTVLRRVLAWAGIL